MGAIDVSALRPSSGATSGAAAHGGPYQFTFGVYNQTSPWSEVRSLIWADLVRLLTSHETGAKEGRCLVPAMFRGTERKKAEADCIDVAFLDSDTGATLREIREAVSHHGWAAIISSTHSHLTTTTRVKRTQWEKFCTGIQLL